MLALWIVLGLLALFLVITVIRAAFWVPKKKEYAALPKEQTDLARYRKNLSDAIKIPTVSYPDESLVDWSQFERFHAFLEERYPLIHKTLKKENISKASLLYTWEGTDKDLDPIAFLSHQDVVPVAEDTVKDWTHPAFAGEDDGEFIWGRGALDMKNHLIGVMESVETLLQEGFQPKRTIYLCFGHDEEVVAAQTSGARSISETLKARGVHLDCVIDEGGAILKVNAGKILNKRLAGIGIAEKGYADFEISVPAKGGHSSQPPVHTGLGKLADVIHDLESHQFKARMPQFVYDLFTSVGKNVPYAARLLTCNLWLLRPLITFVMTKIPPAASLIHTTTAATMATGSPAANVLPQKSTVTVNFRMMPGTTIKDVENHIKKSVRNKEITVTFLKGKEASAVSPTDSRTFGILNELCLRTNKDNIVAPYLVMGGTDAYHYENVCENIYRFAPFAIDPSLLLYTHATNERIPVDSLDEGLKFFKRFMRMASER